MALDKNFTRLALTLLLASPFLGGCPGVIELKSKTAKAGPGKSTVAPILYDDFEQGLAGSYNYANTEGGANCGPAEETTVVHGGKKSQKIAYKSGGGTWGCGFGWGSPYLPKEGYFNAKGTLGVEFWAKGPRGVSFQLTVKEAKANGGDEEVYLAPAVNGTGSWKKYFIPFETFSRGIYSGNQGGDDQLEKGAIGSMEVQFDAKQGDGVIYLDDIYFK